MKSTKYFAILLIVAGGFFAGCKPDPDPVPTEEEIQTELLAGASSKDWKLASGTAVSLDGDDRSTDWSAFELTITTSKGYSTASSFDDNVWPAAGVWDYQGTSGSGLAVMVRSDGISMNIDNVSESNLTLSFDYLLAKPQKNAKVVSIEGNWIFRMVAK